MTTAALLLREVEDMPEEKTAQVLEFAKFLRSKQSPAQLHNGIAIKDAYGIFKDLKGMDTTIEREEEDRV